MKDLFCDLCFLQFDKKYVFDVHMTLVHKKTSSTESPQSKIDKTEVNKEDWDLTEETFESKKEKKPLKCSICDYSCKTKALLKKHIDGVH